MPDKKNFANLHYPGIHPDPREGKVQFTDIATRRFEEQLLCIGDNGLGALMTSSALIIGATPLGVTIARKLLHFGLGRVGIFGNQPDTGAHGITTADQPGSRSVLEHLSRWAKAETPWSRFEAFSDEMADRQLEDIVPGFSILIDTSGPQSALATFEFAEANKLPAAACLVQGKTGWCMLAYTPEKLQWRETFSDLEKQVSDNSNSNNNYKGLYFPCLDLVANRLVQMVFENAHPDDSATPVSRIEHWDASGDRTSTPLKMK